MITITDTDTDKILTESDIDSCLTMMTGNVPFCNDWYDEIKLRIAYHNNTNNYISIHNQFSSIIRGFTDIVNLKYDITKIVNTDTNKEISLRSLSVFLFPYSTPHVVEAYSTSDNDDVVYKLSDRDGIIYDIHVDKKSVRYIKNN